MPSEDNLDTGTSAFKVNYGFLMVFALVASLGIFQLGYVLAANNQAATVLDVEFGLTDQSEKNFYHTMIGSSAVLGATVGSFSAGSIIGIGRRKTMVIFNIIAVIAVTGTIFLNFYSICICRFILGFCGGTFSVVLTRMIEETVPVHLLGTFGIVTNLAMNAGNMTSILMGVGLPDPKDIEAVDKSIFWRIIFGFPWVL